MQTRYGQAGPPPGPVPVSGPSSRCYFPSSMALLRRSQPIRITLLADLTSGSDVGSVYGARAGALVEALRFGVPIPPTYALPVAAFQDAVRNALPPAHDPASLLRMIDRPIGIERTAAARDRLLKLPLAQLLAAEVSAFWTDVGAHAPWGLLVSASPTCPDDTVSVIAGLDATVRGVRSERGLVQAVRFVWASALHVDTLRLLQAHRQRDVAIGVVIQLLDVTAAHGKLLVRSPTTAPPSWDQTAVLVEGGNTTSIADTLALVSCAPGLAAPVIDGTSARDVARLTEDGRLVQVQVAVKPQALVVSASGAEFQAIDATALTHSSLSPEASARLWQLADELSRMGEGPWEADYLVTGGGVVQASALRHAHGKGALPGADGNTVWSRTSIAEELPTTVTPLTWSVLQHVLRKSLWAALRDLGCRLPQSTPLVRSFRGRPYLNLSALLCAVDRVGGPSPLRLLTAVPGPAAVELERQLGAEPGGGSPFGLPVSVARLLSAQRRLEGEVSRWERTLESQRRWLAELDLAILPDDSLVTTLQEARARCDRTLELLVRSTVLLQAGTQLLGHVVRRSTAGGAERTVQTITGGLGKLTTAEIGIALAPVVAIAAKDSAARRTLLSRPVASPLELPHGPARRAVGRFLSAFGDRCAREAELMSPRWAEQSRPVLAMVTAGLRQEVIDPEAAQSYVRVQADAALADLELRLPLIDSALARTLTGRVRSLLALRERLRTSAARDLSALRTVVLDAGRRLSRLDPVLTPGSAFFCTIEELASAMSSARGGLAALARLRSATFERDAGRADPPSSFVGRPPFIELPAVRGAVWQGLACCGGVVAGNARVIGPHGWGVDRLRRDEILVMRTADAALSPLFLMAAGVVTEVGSPFSSGSILAREFGVPMVAGVAAATSSIRDGERLRVDGDHGLVERVEP